MSTLATLRYSLLVGAIAAAGFFAFALTVGLNTTWGEILVWCAIGGLALPIVYTGWERLSH